MSFVQTLTERLTFNWAEPAAEAVAERMERDGAHDVGHILRVLENARKIADGERAAGRTVDWEVVAAAVLFHDAVNLPKDSPRRSEASAMAAELAVGFFRERGTFGEGRLDLVRRAIERHSFSRGESPESLEARIVQEADRLEATGAVGLARTFYVSATMEGQISHPTDPFAEERERDDTAYAIDHFFEKLLLLKDGFQTETGRRMADQRHEVLVGFLEQFSRETGVSLPETSRYLSGQNTI